MSFKEYWRPNWCAVHVKPGIGMVAVQSCRWTRPLSLLLACSLRSLMPSLLLVVVAAAAAATAAAVVVVVVVVVVDGGGGGSGGGAVAAVAAVAREQDGDVGDEVVFSGPLMDAIPRAPNSCVCPRITNVKLAYFHWFQYHNGECVAPTDNDQQHWDWDYVLKGNSFLVDPAGGGRVLPLQSVEEQVIVVPTGEGQDQRVTRLAIHG